MSFSAFYEKHRLYPWGHFVYGSYHVAWCNVCDQAIATWSGPAGLPGTQRKQVDRHLAGHPELGVGEA